MQIRNFTIDGDFVQVLARLDESGAPVFDLSIGTDEDEMTHEGLPYKELIDLCEDIRKELAEVTCYWDDTGRKLVEFDETWKQKEEETE